MMAHNLNLVRIIIFPFKYKTKLVIKKPQQKLWFNNYIEEFLI